MSWGRGQNWPCHSPGTDTFDSMTSHYRTSPQVKFKEFRLLERRRIEASDMVWALLVGSKVAVGTLSDAPNQRALLADEYPHVQHVQRMNQRLDRAAQILSRAESDVCTMALNYTFGLHEDFVRSCMRLLIPLGKVSNKDAGVNSDKMHEMFALRTERAVDPDALALFHLTRRIRNAHTHAAGLVRQDLVDHYLGLTDRQQSDWAELTGESFRVPAVGDSAALGVPGLIGALAIQKRLAYEVNLGLQHAIPREVWADMAVREYFGESGKSLRDPSFVRSAVGYLRGGFEALALDASEIADAAERLKKSGTL